MTYVALVRDLNSIANSYVVGHYVAPTPTVIFDGGVESFMGGYADPAFQIAAYTSRIEAAGTRTVPDLNVISSIDWLGDGAGYYAVRIHVALANGVAPNTGPTSPTVPTGLAGTSPDVDVQFETSSTDAESNLLYCQWDWGDGVISDWMGPYNSGDPMTASHAWSEEATYTVRVKVKDPFGEETGWVEAAPIKVACCQGRVGDANQSGNDEPTIGDVSAMVDAKFISSTCGPYPTPSDPPLLQCLTEADINQSGGPDPTCDDITIGDISNLIDYLFITGPTDAVLDDCL